MGFTNIITQRPNWIQTPKAQLLTRVQSSLTPTSRFSIPSLSLRRSLFEFGLVSQRRLPVPAIGVGNLTWGGNGKAPMVEFMAHSLADSEISPIILTGGYAGGDEARMLRRHLLGTTAKIGVGANRAATAASFFEKYGYVDPRGSNCFEIVSVDQQAGSHLNPEKLVLLFYMMECRQHWSLLLDLEVVWVNGLIPWGNCTSLPLGPLRGPLMALRGADVAAVHHADLDIKIIKMKLEELEGGFNSKPIVVVTEKFFVAS